MCNIENNRMFSLQKIYYYLYLSLFSNNATESDNSFIHLLRNGSTIFILLTFYILNVYILYFIF